MSSLLLIVAVVATVAFFSNRERHTFEVNVHRRTLHKPLASPLTLLHLSDTHFAGPSRKQEAFFDRLAETPYDLIMISGDIMDQEDGIPFAVQCLSKLQARKGIYAVLGNHDYYDYAFGDSFIHNFPWQSYPRKEQNWEALVKALSEAGIHVLRNETLEIEHEQNRILLHGLDDATTGRANVRKAMDCFDENKHNFLLTHTIDVFLDIGNEEIDVSFSGHSHGGQICLPGVGAMVTHTTMGRDFAGGLLYHKGALCSISRGVWTGRFLPFRLFCRPEAIVLELT